MAGCALTDVKREPVLAYMARQPEIDAASKTLEAHRAEFERFRADAPAYAGRARALFAEERFVPLRFTADDVRRAFEAVGQPPDMATDDRFAEAIRAAILHLADKDRRHRLASSLMLHLPGDVAAGRILDAWIIQECAYLTGAMPDRSNVFLFTMFTYGHDAWAAEQRACDAALLGELGMNSARLQGMSMDEIEAWLNEQQANPALRARLEAALRSHPDQQALAIANYEETQRDSITLLEREDLAGLLLSLDELEPWLPRLTESMRSAIGPVPPSDDFLPDPAVRDALQKALLPVFSEMAGAVFTAERRRQLAAQLRSFRNDRFDHDDKRTSALAQAAMTSVEHEDDPARNPFLNALCFASIHRLLDSRLGSQE